MNKYTIKYTMLGLLFLIPGFSYSAQVGFAISPIKTGPTIVYSGQPVTVAYKVVNNSPVLLNANSVSGLPAGVTQALVNGGCGRTFNLAPGKFCLLYLTINADKVKSIPKGIPKVCSARPLYCSLPSPANQLNIVKRPAQTVLTASPVSLTLSAGGATQIVTITNKGKVNASGIAVKLGVPAGVIVANKCPASLSYLAPKNTCQLSFTPGKTPGPTSAIISSSNSPSISVPIKVVAPQQQAALILSSPTLNMTVGSDNGNSLTITNTSNIIVEKITAQVPKGFATPKYSDKCAILGNGQQCVIKFTVTEAVEDGEIYISGKNMKSYTIKVNAVPASEASLRVDRMEINLSPGGKEEMVELSNTSTTADANNLQWTLPEGVTLASAGSPCDKHSLPKGQRCKLVFKAKENAPLTELYKVDETGEQTGSKSSGATITIEADKTKPVQIGVTITQAVLRMINELSAQPYNLTVDKSTFVGELYNEGNVALTELNFTPTDNWQLDTSDPANCTQGGTIPAKESCKLWLVVSSPTSDENGQYPIKIQASGSGSNQLTISFNGTNDTAPKLSVDSSATSASSFLVSLDNRTKGIAIKVSNTGATDTTLSATLPEGWEDDGLKPSIPAACQPLRSGTSCTIKVNAQLNTGAHLPGMMTISGDNGANSLSFKVAMLKGGGVIFAIQNETPMGIKMVKVAYLTDSSSAEGSLFPWILAESTDNLFVATSVDDGVLNSKSIVETLGGGVYAAGRCNQLNPSKIIEKMDTGWYLPAICELGYNLKGSPVETCSGGDAKNDMTNLSGIPGSTFTSPLGAYWSSTEGESGMAYMQKFDESDTYQDKLEETSSMGVRCIRSFTLE